MRKIVLFVVLAVAAVVAVGLTPSDTGACPPWRGHVSYGQPIYYSAMPQQYAAPQAGYNAAPPAPMPMPSRPQGPELMIHDNMFQPAMLNVPVGTTVRWVNHGRNMHTVTADDGSFDSGNIAPGASFSHKFDKEGTVKYHCKLHQGMAGTMVVRAANAPPPGRTPAGASSAPAAPGGGAPKGSGY